MTANGNADVLVCRNIVDGTEGAAQLLFTLLLCWSQFGWAIPTWTPLYPWRCVVSGTSSRHVSSRTGTGNPGYGGRVFLPTGSSVGGLDRSPGCPSLMCSSRTDLALWQEPKEAAAVSKHSPWTWSPTPHVLHVTLATASFTPCILVPRVPQVTRPSLRLLWHESIKTTFSFFMGLSCRSSPAGWATPVSLRSTRDPVACVWHRLTFGVGSAEIGQVETSGKNPKTRRVGSFLPFRHAAPVLNTTLDTQVSPWVCLPRFAALFWFSARLWNSPSAGAISADSSRSRTCDWNQSCEPTWILCRP